MNLSLIFFLILIPLTQGNVEYVSTYPYYFPYKVSTAELYLKPIGKEIWQFIVPPNMYASVRVMANFSDSDYFVIYNTANMKIAYNSPQPLLNGEISQNVSETYHFPGNFTITIEMITRKAWLSRRLSFSFELYEIPNKDISKLCVTTTLQARQLLHIPYITLYPGEVGKKIMISIATGELIGREVGRKTDACFVYEGNSCGNGTFISGIMSLSQAYLESSTNITVCCVTDEETPIYSLLYFFKPDSIGPNDTWISRRTYNETFSVTLNNIEFSGDSNCTQYLTTYSNYFNADHLETIEPTMSSEFDNESSFAMYVGMPLTSDSFKLTENPLSDRETWLPQEVRGEFRTYVLKNTDARLSFTDIRHSKWVYPNRSRKGFVMTQRFTELRSDQNTYTFFTTTTTVSKLIIHSNKTIVDLVEQASFVIASRSGKNLIKTKYFITENSSDLEISGNYYTFEFETGSWFGPPTIGGIIYFDLVFPPDVVFYKTSIFVYSVIAVFCIVICISGRVVYVRRT